MKNDFYKTFDWKLKNLIQVFLKEIKPVQLENYKFLSGQKNVFCFFRLFRPLKSWFLWKNQAFSFLSPVNR